MKNRERWESRDRFDRDRPHRRPDYDRAARSDYEDYASGPSTGSASRHRQRHPPSARFPNASSSLYRNDSLSSEPTTSHHRQAQLRYILLPSSRAGGNDTVVFGRARKAKGLGSRTRSLSSSEEELPSTSDCPSCDDRELDSESFSEKGPHALPSRATLPHTYNTYPHPFRFLSRVLLGGFFARLGEEVAG